MLGEKRFFVRRLLFEILERYVGSVEKGAFFFVRTNR